jgi:ANTAR domain/GAF domain
MVDEQDTAGVAPTFEALAVELRSGKSEEDAYQAIADWSVRLISGCDHASVSIVRNGEFTTLGASDDIARHIDTLEREVGNGPCLDAIRHEHAQYDPDITDDDVTWPDLAARVIAETPVRSMLAFRLVHQGEKSGALNLFGDAPNSLNRESVDQGTILSAFASVAFAMAQERRRASNLEIALNSNREIGKAIGLLMATHNVGSDQAFEILKHASQTMNRKLRELADEIVARGEADHQTGSMR